MDTPNRRVRRRGLGRGFTLIELLVVIAIIALLMSILLPALGQAKEHAKTTVCLTRLKGIGLAVQQYAGDHREILLPGKVMLSEGSVAGEKPDQDWPSLLSMNGYVVAPRYVGSDAPAGGDTVPQAAANTLFRCPSGTMTVEESPGSTSRRGAVGPHAFPAFTLDEEAYTYCWYAGNGDNHKWKNFPMTLFYKGPEKTKKHCHTYPELRYPAKMAAICDGWWMVKECWWRIITCHNNFEDCNIMMWDGHAETVSEETLPIGNLRDNDPDGATWKDTWPLWRLDHQ
jgi:prepilin-type N-terminal cleavage/methylation domain-containing protein/prepilin-type processing-associated H-X9-DG protein